MARRTSGCRWARIEQGLTGLAAAVLTMISVVAVPARAEQDAAAGAPATSAVPAKDAGLRYGQALGVLEVCYGSRLTDKAKSLEQSYEGAEREAFKSAAAGVYQAWVKVRTCTNQRDPNTCKIIMDKSCLAAEAEIGPSGTALPGLIEFFKAR